MAIYLKNNAVGIDAKINKMINRINVKLSGWGLDVYGRMYNIKEEPKAHVSGIDYKPVFVDDRVNVCGFIVQNTRDIANSNNGTAIVDVVFSIELDKIYPTSTQREDERAMLEAYQVVNSSGWKVIKVKETIPEVFSGFNTESIKNRDYQPFFHFSLSCEISYNLGNCLN